MCPKPNIPKVQQFQAAQSPVYSGTGTAPGTTGRRGTNLTSDLSNGSGLGPAIAGIKKTLLGM